MADRIKNIIRKFVRTLKYDLVKYPCPYPSDINQDDINIYKKIHEYTATSVERVSALCNAVRYVVNHNVPGDIVECGVWKGGSMMAVALTLLELGVNDRNLYLFDTFEGMTKPTDKDISYAGEHAIDFWTKSRRGCDASNWSCCSMENVKHALCQIGYDNTKLQFVKGKVEKTIPIMAPEKISILRLDTDWYESTKHELIHLFPRLSLGGVLIIDDYGHWQGAKLAADEYFKEHKTKILLNRIDYTGRIAVKLR